MTVLTIILPIFVIIAIGYAFTRFGIFRPGDMQVLGRFVLYIALPALLFGATATRDFGQSMSGPYLVVFTLGSLATAAAVWLWHRATGTGPVRRAIAVMGSNCPNSVYFGYPILLTLMPDEAGVILAMNTLAENFVILPVSFLIFDFARAERRAGLWRELGRTLLSVIRRPMILALLAGIAVSLAGIPVPEWIARGLGTLGAGTAGVALVVLGGSLAGLPMAGNRTLAAQIAASKLLLHPALVALAAAALPLLGLGLLPRELWVAAVVSTAGPMIGLYTVLSQGAGHDGLAPLALLYTTVASFFTLTALLAVVI